jgi:hypothetical protein
MVIHPCGTAEPASGLILVLGISGPSAPAWTRQRYLTENHPSGQWFGARVWGSSRDLNGKSLSMQCDGGTEGKTGSAKPKGQSRLIFASQRSRDQEYHRDESYPD